MVSELRNRTKKSKIKFLPFFDDFSGEASFPCRSLPQPPHLTNGTYGFRRYRGAKPDSCRRRTHLQLQSFLSTIFLLISFSGDHLTSLSAHRALYDAREENPRASSLTVIGCAATVARRRHCHMKCCSCRISFSSDSRNSSLLRLSTSLF